MIANGDAAEAAEHGIDISHAGGVKGKGLATTVEEGRLKVMRNAREQMELVFEVLGRMKSEDLHPGKGDRVCVHTNRDATTHSCKAPVRLMANGDSKASKIRGVRG